MGLEQGLRRPYDYNNPPHKAPPVRSLSDTAVCENMRNEAMGHLIGFAVEDSIGRKPEVRITQDYYDYKPVTLLEVDGYYKIFRVHNLYKYQDKVLNWVKYELIPVMRYGINASEYAKRRKSKLGIPRRRRYG